MSGNWVLELPMRVWNPRYASILTEPSSFVLELPMRVWNCLPKGPLERLNRFWSYLWGFETHDVAVSDVTVAGFGVTYEGLKPAISYYCVYPLDTFWSYLWGFETHILDTQAGCRSLFWSYLWGFETQVCAEKMPILCRRFGVTYEGLKPACAAVGEVEFIVLELPMRVWNVRKELRAFFSSWFWSYLWGFETLGHSANGSTAIVLELPMRVWNLPRITQHVPSPPGGFGVTYEGLKRAYSNALFIIFFVLELPMRVWNKTIPGI